MGPLGQTRLSSRALARNTLDSGHDNGYFKHLANWTASWVSFEVAESVGIEIELENAARVMSRYW